MEDTKSITCAAIRCDSDDLMVPQKLSVKQKSPIPSRILREMDEDVWISGSELRTDNSSSSEEDREHEHRTSFTTKDIKRKRMKKIVPIIKNQSIFGSEMTTTMANATEDKENDQTPSISAALDEKTHENIVWRPKRGSITLMD